MPAAMPSAGGAIQPVADTAAAAAAGSLAERANRLANAAFQMSGQLYAEEGARYGASNAPSAEQLLDANARGVEVSLPGNTFSIRGRAARDAAIDVLAIDVQMSGTEAIAKAAAEATAAGVPPEQFRGQLDEIGEGFRSAMLGVDAKAAIELNARMGLYANSQYVNYTKAWNEKIEQQRQTEAVVALDKVRQQFPAIIGAGNLIGPDGTMTTPHDRLEVAISATAEMMAQRGFTPEKIQSQINAMRTGFDAEMANHWSGVARSPQYTGRGVALYNQFRRGKFDDPDHQELYAAMSPAQREQAMDGILSSIRDNEAVMSAAERGSDLRRTEAIDDIKTEYYDAKLAGDAQAMMAAAQKIRAYDPDEYGRMVGDINRPAAEKSDPQTKANLAEAIRRDDPGVRTRIREEAVAGNITFDDATALTADADARSDGTVKFEVNDMRLRYGLSEDPGDDDSQDKRVRRQILNEVEADLRRYRKNNPDATPADIEKQATQLRTKVEDRLKGRDLDNMREQLESDYNRPGTPLRNYLDGRDPREFTDIELQGIIEDRRADEVIRDWARDILEKRGHIRAMEGVR